MWLEGYTLNNKLILEHSVPKASQGQRLMANSNPSSTSLPSGICTVEYCRSDWTWPQNEERLQKLPLGTLRVSWLWGHLGGWTRTAVRVCVCVCALRGGCGSNDVFSCHVQVVWPSPAFRFRSLLYYIGTCNSQPPFAKLNRCGHGLLIQPN